MILTLVLSIHPVYETVLHQVRWKGNGGGPAFTCPLVFGMRKRKDAGTAVESCQYPTVRSVQQSRYAAA